MGDGNKYLGSNIPSTESVVTTRRGKHWLLLTGCSLYGNLISMTNKKGFFSKSGPVGTTLWIHSLDSHEMLVENVWWQIYKNATCSFEQILEETPHKTVVRPLASHLTNHPGQTNKKQLTERDVRRNSQPTFSYELQQVNSSTLCWHWMLFRGPARSRPSRLRQQNTPTVSLQRGKTHLTSVLDMTLSNLMVSLQ